MADYDAALRMQLHYLPSSFPIKNRRAENGRCWLECAAIRGSQPQAQLLVLRYCCSWSPVAIDIAVDAATGLVFTESHAPAVSEVCDRLNGVMTSRAARVQLTALASHITKAVDAASEAIWPRSGVGAWTLSLRSPLESVAADIAAGLINHPALATARNDRERGMCIADGLALQSSLLSTALFNLRRTLICKPVPHWLTGGCNFAGSRDGTFGSTPNSSDPRSPIAAIASSRMDVSSPHSAAVDVDAAGLDRAIAGLGSIRNLVNKCGKFDLQVLSSLSIDSLLLLYFLLALAPMRLIRLPSPTVSGAAASFCVVHGAVVSSCYSADAAAASSPANRHSTLCGPALPLWDKDALRQYGRYPGNVRWFHGTATDNAYAALNFGLRSLSGTRHQSSGDMYGTGVYVTNSVSVAQNFAKKTGSSWTGFSVEHGGFDPAAEAGDAGAGPAGGPRISSQADTVRGPGSRSSSSFWTNLRSPLARSSPSSSDSGPKCKLKPSTMRTVLELDLIAAPGNKIMVEGTDISKLSSSTDSGSRTPADGASRSSSVHLPSSCYAVVPDACHLWILALHIFDDDHEARKGTQDGSLNDAVPDTVGAEAWLRSHPNEGSAVAAASDQVHASAASVIPDVAAVQTGSRVMTGAPGAGQLQERRRGWCGIFTAAAVVAASSVVAAVPALQHWIRDRIEAVGLVLPLRD